MNIMVTQSLESPYVYLLVTSLFAIYVNISVDVEFVNDGQISLF